ncbi:MAG: UPF0280 family protein [Thermodesulfobacteriota bacterium]|nr:UPF0280 family protein [Thermodesulfobacteriota bacterium]
MYQPRVYRDFSIKKGEYTFQVAVKESDLYIRAERNLKKQALELLLKYRLQIENYIRKYPVFSSSLIPLKFDSLAPPIIKTMMKSSIIAGVGPMASVAGALAEFVGKDLMPFSRKIIIENGGDIFLNVQNETNVGILTPESSIGEKIGIKVSPENMPLGICTSSGTIGHSLSFGKSDAVCVLSSSTPLADALATSVANRIKGKNDIYSAIEFGKKIEGVLGIVIIFEKAIGSWGDVELVRL